MNETKVEKEDIKHSEPITLQTDKTNTSKKVAFDQVASKWQSIPKSKIIIVGCIFALIVIGGLVSMPSQNEKRAIECVKELKTLAVEPNSLGISGDILVHDLEWTEEDGDYVVVLRYVDGSEDFRFTDMAYYSDMGFVDHRGYQKSDYDYIKDAKSLRLIDGEICEEMWNDYGNEYFDNSELQVEIVSGKYVARKTGCTFIE